MPESDDLLGETLAELQRGGQYDSTGGLIIASDKIAPRYRTFVEQEPAYPVLNLLSLGWSWGVRKFEVRLDDDLVRVHFKVSQMSPELLATSEGLARGNISIACSGLARSLWSTLSLPLEHLRVRLIGHLQGLELSFAEGELRCQPLPALNHAGLQFEFRSPWMSKFRSRWQQPGGWLENLAHRAAFFPGELLVNNLFVAHPADAAIIGPPTRLTSLGVVATRLVENTQNYFAAMPCYAYAPRSLAWTGGHRSSGSLEQGYTEHYYLESPRLSRKSCQIGAFEGSRALVSSYTAPLRLCLVNEPKGVKYLENCPDLLGRLRRFGPDPEHPQHYFTSAPLCSDLLVWRQGTERSTVHFVAQGLLLNPIPLPQMPPGHQVVALAPPELHRDLSGWNVIQGDELDRVLARVKEEVTRLLSSADAEQGPIEQGQVGN